MQPSIASRSAVSPGSSDSLRAGRAASPGRIAAGTGARLAAGGLAHRSRRAQPTSAATDPEAYVVSMVARAWTNNPIRKWLYSVGREPDVHAPPEMIDPRRFAAASQTAVLYIAAAAGCSLLLYWGKSRADVLDREIVRVIHATHDTRAETFALRAEWASLNAPDRLRDMANRYLKLRPITPPQYVALSGLRERLSAAPTQPVAPIADTPVPVASADPGPTRQAAPAQTLPEAEAPSPAHTQAAVTLAAAASAPVHPHAVRPPVRAGATVLAHFDAHPAAAGKYELPHWLTDAHPSHPVPRIMSEPPHMLTLPPSSRPLPLATPQPAGPRTQEAMAQPVPQPQTAPAVAAPPSAPAASPYVAQGYRPAYGYPYGTTYAQTYRPPYGSYYGGYYGGTYVGGSYGRAYVPPPVPNNVYIQ
jgi:hypothetical protein